VEVASTEVDAALEALAHGVPPSGAEAVANPFWLVCTNGRRDLCCGKDGIPVARALAAHDPRAAWECSHLGGHRFAANVLLVPEGLCFGRVREETATSLTDGFANDRLPLELLRGRTTSPPAAQAAEVAGRVHLDQRSFARVPVAQTGDGFTIADVHVRLVEEPLAPRAISCDAPPEPLSAWRVVEVAGPT
jgi:hypothetical protein